MDGSRGTSKRTTASRRRRRVELGQSATTVRVGVKGPTVPLVCGCGKRLARVSLDCPDPRTWYSQTNLDVVCFYDAIDGVWGGGRFENYLQKRNRKGIAGETHLEGRWDVTCPKCGHNRGGRTSQLVALVLRARENRSGEVRLSEVSLGSVSSVDPDETLRRWVATRSR